MPRHPLALDARSPSIIVPLTGRDMTELKSQSLALSGAPVDLVEWRVDLYRPFTAGEGTEPALAVAALHRITELLPDLPVLATFRTADEGGATEIGTEAYVGLVSALAGSDLADAVDVEYRHPGAPAAIASAHAAGTPVVASHHDFDGTPPASEIVARLTGMEKAGAEVAKIAVMPRTAADVVTLLAATERRYRDASIPLITMAMGPLGAVSRIGGGVFGSAATFATVSAASAPGQLPAAGVRQALDLLQQ